MAETPPTTTAQLSPRGRVAMAAICFATGAGIAALAAGIIPAAESDFHAPRWVIGACGLVFMLAAVMILTPASMVRTQYFLGAVLLSLFAAIPGWIAFGPSPREFSGSVSIGVVTSATHPGDSTGRIVFGIAAIVGGLIAAYAWARWLRSVIATRDDERGDTAD